MTNTLENKEKFFAQYWGQDVVNLDGINEIPVYKMFNPIRTEETQRRSYLELTPLSQISDEDAIEVAELAFGYSKFNRNIKVTKTSPRNFGFSFYHNSINNDHLEYFIDFGGFYNPTIICLSRKTLPQEYIHNVQGIVDFLRSRGYALPWMGMSVDTLVEWGWVKLIRGEND